MSSTAPNLKPAPVAAVFAALGDETRLQLVGKLCKQGPQSISRLTEGTAVSRQAITKHLQALSDAGVVRSARVGRERIWEVRTKRLAEVQRYLDRISHDWDDAIRRLRALVESD